MNALPGRSFAVKLTLLITLVSGVATALVCATLVTLQVRRALGGAVETAHAHARVIAANSTAALDFDDPAAASETLAGLAAVPEFAAAQISTPEGEVFARYERGGAGEVPALGAHAPTHIQGQWLSLTEPIVRDQEHIGNVTLLYDLSPGRRQLRREVAIAAAVAAAAIVLSFLAARRLQRTLLRPVRELSRAAGAITSTDDYDIVARKYSDDELGVLTDVFNTMIRRIKEAEAIRRDHQATLEREVARRTAEVLETQARLRQSERMASLGTLSAGLGHDIGNILMPLRSHLSSIRDKFASGARADGSDFDAISKSTEYLQNLSTGLRSLAQDPDMVATPSEATQIAPWWTTTEPLLRAMIGSRIELEADLPADLPRVKASKSLLTQAVFNLVQNAAQAMTPEGGAPSPGARIRVWGAVARGDNGARRIRLAVTDNGPGMTEEVRGRCLEPYFTTRTRRISSGLGLALVKGIAENVGGALEIESELGKGSTFSLILPAQDPPQAGKVRVVVTISESRRRAVVSHLLTSLNCQVQIGAAGSPAAEPPPDEGGSGADGGGGGASGGRGLWVTDALNIVPALWHGRVVVLGNAPEGSAIARGRTIVVDPSTPLPALRKLLLEILPLERDDEYARS